MTLLPPTTNDVDELAADDAAARGDASAASENLAVRAQGWVLEHWPATLRRRLAVIGVIVGVALITISWLTRLLGVVLGLDLLGYFGLMGVCWIGAGGALIPVPGVRPLSWIMIVNQGAVSNPVLVAALAALAMALGQSSYFAAVRTEHRRHAHARAPAADDAGTSPLTTSAASAVTADGSGNPVEPGSRLVARSRAILARARAAVRSRMVLHPQRIIFLLCVVPNPLTTFATVTGASAGVRFWRFFVASLAGFLVLTLALAVVGQAILIALGLF